MSRVRRRKHRARLGDPPSDRERELWRMSVENLKARMATDSMRESTSLRLEAIDLGAESRRLYHERTGR